MEDTHYLLINDRLYVESYWSLTAIICFYLVDNNIYVMKEVTFDDVTSMDTALQEKQLMSKVSHRNVCKYVDSFVESGNKLYLIMEYADKGDLKQYLQRLKSMAIAASTAKVVDNNNRYYAPEPREKQLITEGPNNGLIELGEQRTWKFFI